MKYGINLLLWTAELNDGLLPTFEWLRSIGYDGVELPLFNPGLNYGAWGRRLDEFGLERSAVTVRTAADNPISPDSAVRAAGVEANKRVIDCCVAAGASMLGGPFYSAHGEFTGQGPTDDEWAWGVESMRIVAEHAGDAGVVLALEPLNRFETYLLTTQADAARFVAQVDHPACQVMFDTFHAHIEEKDSSAAIRVAGERIRQVHISENDRSTPGAGSVRWDETFDTLHDIGYDGWMTVEAFGLAMPEVASATKIWRRMYDSEQQLAREALAFMQKQVATRWV
ncbi:D-tagatose 3-epimerase [Pirellulimonas nuda]|uniref:D-tagatose 3-epimerase n=1 Tax=Pirellulimonas nuda TaxID=2528009 RepID=A0A518D988_9BACT|nr:sugar phosphate isomerase/epimerase family protein [Pirellulimonas nuda]QDU88037.1 D-tagatose 3-epimerase [Pirellulimonas nuda]